MILVKLFQSRLQSNKWCDLKHEKHSIGNVFPSTSQEFAGSTINEKVNFHFPCVFFLSKKWRASLSYFGEVISVTVAIPPKLCWCVSNARSRPNISRRIRRIVETVTDRLVYWFLGPKCHRKVFPWFFPFEDFVFFAEFVDRFGSSIPKFKFERVKLRGGRRGHFKMARGHFKCQTVAVTDWWSHGGSSFSLLSWLLTVLLI